MSRLAALFDGAKTDLDAKLELLSEATAKEGIVRQAEEHAQELMKLAMDFQMYVMSSPNIPKPYFCFQSSFNEFMCLVGSY